MPDAPRRTGIAHGWVVVLGWRYLTEPKTAKNRCHVDLLADDRDGVQAEVDRLVGLGATLVREPKEEWGTYWASIQDPEGNELCIGAE